MPDILDLILADHAAMRRAFSELDAATTQAERSRIWTELAFLLEVHARAEERIFYPSLLHRGKHPDHDTRDAISDHNKLREAIAASRAASGGDVAWWAAVKSARKENDEHLAEEERGPIVNYREHAPATTREELGQKFIEFHANHANGAGITPDLISPKEFVKRND